MWFSYFMGLKQLYVLLFFVTCLCFSLRAFSVEDSMPVDHPYPTSPRHYQAPSEEAQEIVSLVDSLASPYREVQRYAIRALANHLDNIGNDPGKWNQEVFSNDVQNKLLDLYLDTHSHAIGEMFKILSKYYIITPSVELRLTDRVFADDSAKKDSAKKDSAKKDSATDDSARGFKNSGPHKGSGPTQNSGPIPELTVKHEDGYLFHFFDQEGRPNHKMAVNEIGFKQRILQILTAKRPRIQTTQFALEYLLRQSNPEHWRTAQKILISGQMVEEVQSHLVDNFFHPNKKLRAIIHRILLSQQVYPEDLKKLLTYVYRDRESRADKVKMVVRFFIQMARKDRLQEMVIQDIIQRFSKAPNPYLGALVENIARPLNSAMRTELMHLRSHPNLKYRKIAIRKLEDKKPGLLRRCVQAFALSRLSN